MAKTKPPEPTTEWWTKPVAKHAIEKIEMDGHKCFRRRQSEHNPAYVGVVYKDTKLKRPGEFTDIEFFNLDELTDFAHLGKESYLAQRELDRHKKLARVITCDMQDGTVRKINDGGLAGPGDLHRTAMKWFNEEGIRIRSAVGKNPFDESIVENWRLIYGYWMWGGEEQFMVCVRPADESSLRLPSCWLRTI